MNKQSGGWVISVVVTAYSHHLHHLHPGLFPTTPPTASPFLVAEPLVTLERMNGELDDAVAGPSSIRPPYSGSTNATIPTVPTPHLHAAVNTSAVFPSIPLVYVPPAGMYNFPSGRFSCSVAFDCRIFLVPSLKFSNEISLMIAPPPPRQHLASTQDLLSRLQLLPAYDKYVRPSLDGSLGAIDGAGNINAQSLGTTPNPMSHFDKGKGREVPVHGGDVDMHDPNDAEEEDGKGDKKKRNSYKHLIGGIPGKSDISTPFFFGVNRFCLLSK